MDRERAKDARAVEDPIAAIFDLAEGYDDRLLVLSQDLPGLGLNGSLFEPQSLGVE